MRVVIGADQALMREGLVLPLERAGFEIVGVPRDGHDLVQKARAPRARPVTRRPARSRPET